MIFFLLVFKLMRNPVLDFTIYFDVCNEKAWSVVIEFHEV